MLITDLRRQLEEAHLERFGNWMPVEEDKRRIARQHDLRAQLSSVQTEKLRRQLVEVAQEKQRYCDRWHWSDEMLAMLQVVCEDHGKPHFVTEARQRLKAQHAS